MKRSVVSVVLNDQKNRVLLLKRRDVPIWVLPGGGVEAHETMPEAAFRETLEETGLQVSIVRQVGLYLPANRLTNHTEVYEAKYAGGQLSIGAETQALAFFPLEQLPKPFFFLHRIWMEETLSQKPFIIKRQLHEITYTKLGLYFLKHPLQVMRLVLSRCGLAWNSKG